VYNLSKRTAVYTTVARVSNKNGASLGVNDPTFYAPATGANLFTPKTSIGYDFGIRHAF
jgi:predicted porin